jgi:hypothetical protein
MKTTILATGIVLIIMGISGYISMKDFMIDCQSTASKGGIMGGYFMQLCDQLQMMQQGLIATGVAGAGVMIYGIVAKNKPKKKIDPQTAPQTTFDLAQMEKNLDEMREKHRQLEEKYTRLMQYLRKNAIEVPDFLFQKESFSN